MYFYAVLLPWALLGVSQIRPFGIHVFLREKMDLVFKYIVFYVILAPWELRSIAFYVISAPGHDKNIVFYVIIAPWNLRNVVFYAIFVLF